MFKTTSHLQTLGSLMCNVNLILNKTFSFAKKSIHKIIQDVLNVWLTSCDCGGFGKDVVNL